MDEDPLERLPQTAQMRRDLAEPDRREALRAEYKAGLPDFYPDLTEVLGLTAQQQNQLFDLLADFQMRHLDIFYAPEPGGPPAKMGRFQRNEAQREAAMPSVLGPETLEKYRRYLLELPERQFVAELNAHLAPTGVLSQEQKSRMLAVVKADQERTRKERQERSWSRRHSLPAAPTPAQLRQANIEANEDLLPQMEAQRQRFLREAAPFLTPSQLDVLTRLERRKLDGQRRWLDSVRADEQNTDLVVTSQGVIVTAHKIEGPERP